jgi:hypothetical protein
MLFRPLSNNRHQKKNNDYLVGIVLFTKILKSGMEF